jgi:hypothetical protein
MVISGMGGLSKPIGSTISPTGLLGRGGGGEER